MEISAWDLRVIEICLIVIAGIALVKGLVIVALLYSTYRQLKKSLGPIATSAQRIAENLDALGADTRTTARDVSGHIAEMVSGARKILNPTTFTVGGAIFGVAKIIRAFFRR